MVVVAIGAFLGFSMLLTGGFESPRLPGSRGLPTEVARLLALVSTIGLFYLLEKVRTLPGKAIDELARQVRERIRDHLVDPWQRDFEARLMSSEKRSYIVDSETLSACASLAVRLYNMRKFIPEDAEFRERNHVSLPDYLTETGPTHFPTPMLDAHWGKPTGYVDAFLEILATKDGTLPSDVLLNAETGEIAMTPRSGERYETIALRVD